MQIIPFFPPPFTQNYTTHLLFPPPLSFPSPLHFAPHQPLHMELCVKADTWSHCFEYEGGASLAQLKHAVMLCSGSCLQDASEFDLLIDRDGGAVALTGDGDVPGLCQGDTVKVVPSVYHQAVATLKHMSIAINSLSLLNAAWWGDMDVCQLLLHAGVPVDVKDADGLTPLACAAETGSLPLCELLLAQGADVDVEDSKGMSSLRRAVLYQNGDVASLLKRYSKVR